jgi:hypothetical protein
MKWILVILATMSFQLATAQVGGNNVSKVVSGEKSEVSKKLSDGSVEVTGLDYFGAQVLVRYNKSGERVYQERTLQNETTFAHFENGVVTKYGTAHIISRK